MRANSLALRLFLWATGATVAILLITGVVLSSLYQSAVERAFDQQLESYLRALISDLALPPEEAGDKFPQSLGEPLFNLPLSGWYWQITQLGASEPHVRSSRSLWEVSLPRLEDDDVVRRGALRFGYVQGPEEQHLRLLERIVDFGQGRRFLVAVAGDAAGMDDEIDSFNRALILTFAILAAVLLLTTMFQVRFGLAPLRRISQSLAAIRSGAAERLEGRFPVEIAPLARETNALLDANREIVERARMHVGNLAHALKTPLSVMLNEANARGDDPFAAKVREQVNFMREQVTRHLERARLAARAAVLGSVTDVAPVVQALVRTMEKIYHDKNLAIAFDIPPAARFRGERQDLEEMVGNLIDNACKWAATRVAIEVGLEQADRPLLRIVIDDDGPGLSPAEREQVAKRGRRLDESKPGSGLGLSIVVELAALYGGALALGAAPIGGLRAELVLPAA